MSGRGLGLRHETGRQVDVTAEGALLWRYVYRPETPAGESPRPYAHPVCAATGEVLTNFRPNDHPWHHGLSLTLTRVDGVNFWGGPSYRAADGYRWRDDHGCQEHTGWTTLTPERLEETLVWRAGAARGGGELLAERRVIETRIQGSYAGPVADGWELRWTSELRNVAGRDLRLGNYHADDGLAGSHYTGLQFRGARDLLDEHGDPEIGIGAAGDLRGEAAVHGAGAEWMEWRCRHDTTLRRTRIRFGSPGTPCRWFVRAKNPVAAFAFQGAEPTTLAAGAELRLEHTLSFTPI